MAGGKDPAFPLYAQDWLTDDRLAVADLADLGRLVCLWSWLWLHGPQTMARLRAVAHLMRSTADEVESLAREWLTEGPDGCWSSLRLEAERAERIAIRKQRAEAGRSSGASRRKLRELAEERESNGNRTRRERDRERESNETANGNRTGRGTKREPPSPSPTSSPDPSPNEPTNPSNVGCVPKGPREEGVGGLVGDVRSKKGRGRRSGPRSARDITESGGDA